MKRYCLLLITSLIFIHCGPSAELTKKEYLNSRINTFSEELIAGRIIGPLPPSVKLNDIKIDEAGKRITLVYNRDLSYIPFREENVEEIYRRLTEYTDGDYSFSVETMNKSIEELIPNFYRENILPDVFKNS
jgi:hypothetical protein